MVLICISVPTDNNAHLFLYTNVSSKRDVYVSPLPIFELGFCVAILVTELLSIAENFGVSYLP